MTDLMVGSRLNASILWKKQIVEILKKEKIIDNNYTGKLVFNFNQGGLTSIKYEFELR